ncbi:hypothetical protein BC831DRAFT_482010 [Entophlyctis helioformis]|nr:hypothetical protein BC831DRAFT_482010 [Entophlyctis helioformis]
MHRHATSSLNRLKCDTISPRFQVISFDLIRPMIEINGTKYTLTEADKSVINSAKYQFAISTALGGSLGIVTGAYFATKRRWSIPSRLFLSVFLGGLGLYPGVALGASLAQYTILNHLPPSPLRDVVHEIKSEVLASIEKKRSVGITVNELDPPAAIIKNQGRPFKLRMLVNNENPDWTRQDPITEDTIKAVTSTTTLIVDSETIDELFRPNKKPSSS